MNNDSDTSADLNFNILDDNDNKINLEAMNNNVEEHNKTSKFVRPALPSSITNVLLLQPFHIGRRN